MWRLSVIGILVGVVLWPVEPAVGHDSYGTWVGQAAERFCVPPSLIQAVIQVESSGHPKAYRRERNGDVSRGLMQVTLATARWLGYKGAPEGLFDPRTNIELGTHYLAWQIRRYEGDVQAAVAAYNAGSAKKRKDGSFVNQRYVDRILFWYQRFSRDPDQEAPPAEATGRRAQDGDPEGRGPAGALLLAVCL